ncbi:hypothetical protein ACIPRI_17420 [Variovorax sp. LARHSF232]
MSRPGSFNLAPDNAVGATPSRWRHLLAPIVPQLVLAVLAAILAGLYLFPMQ